MPSPKSSLPPKKRSADSSQIAFERLRQAILTGELKEGEKVRETRLAAEWQIGITPLREAVRRMAEVGYLILQPNHAPIVRKLGVEDIRQIYALRELLECFALKSEWEAIRCLDFAPLRKKVAAAKAAPSLRKRLQAQFALDTALHEIWISPRHNPWLASSLERLLIYRPNLMNVIAVHPKFADEAFEEHQRILAALEAGSLAKALELLGKHIQKSGFVLAALTEANLGSV